MTENDHNQFDDELMARARDLAREIQPQRDLWAQIETAITRPASPSILPWTRYLAQAAAVILLVGGSSGLTYLAVSTDNAGVSPGTPTNGIQLNARSASFGNQYTLGPDFQDARRDLEGRLEQELERLSPEARSEVKMNMRTIRAAIDEINKALADEPDNVLLQELLLSSYQEELALMRKVNGITNVVMLRQDI